MRKFEFLREKKRGRISCIMNGENNRTSRKKPVIVLDAGKVLVDFHLDRLMSGLSRMCGESLSFPLPPELDAVWKALEKGRYSWGEFTATVNRLFSVSIDAEELEQLWCGIFIGEIPGMRSVLSSLGGEFTLIALSNTCEVHWSYVVDKYPIFQLLDGWVVSFEEGCLKPDPGLYRIVMKRFCGNRPPFYYTDDSSDFVEAARKLSWNADVFTGADQFQKELALRRA